MISLKRKKEKLEETKFALQVHFPNLKLVFDVPDNIENNEHGSYFSWDYESKTLSYNFYIEENEENRSFRNRITMDDDTISCVERYYLYENEILNKILEFIGSS